jgi:hypothetical protein
VETGAASRPWKRLRTAHWVALVGGSLVGVIGMLGGDAAGRVAILVIPLVAGLVAWLDWRTGVTRRQLITSVLLTLVAALASRVVAFVVVFLWAYGYVP